MRKKVFVSIVEVGKISRTGSRTPVAAWEDFFGRPLEVEAEGSRREGRSQRTIGRREKQSASFFLSCQPTLSSRSGASSACEKRHASRRSVGTRRNRGGARRESRRGNMVRGIDLETPDLDVENYEQR